VTRAIRLIADDYGLAPGVGEAILDLIERGRLSGTGCMTGLDDWPTQAARLVPLRGRAAIGLHLTLTDQPALTGRSSLAPDGILPALGTLALPLRRGNIEASDVHAELDAQLARFVSAFGRAPAFVDGHQHVHFLPAVRAWLRHRFAGQGDRPWLRGAPAVSAGLNASRLKSAAVRLLAAGFDEGMRQAGFEVMGPLAGLYDWRRPEGFGRVAAAALRSLPEAGIFMCHPGRIDETLRGRDPMQAAREAEHDFLASDAFGAALETAGVTIVQEA